MLIQGFRIRSIAVRASGAAAVATDEYFNLVALLLPGNGTNGQQNNTFLDASTNNFTVTRNGNTTQGTFSPFSQTGWSNYFDGTGDYLSTPNAAALRLGAGDFTVEAWIYPNRLTNTYGQPICGTYGYVSTQDRGWGLLLNDTGYLRILMFGSAGAGFTLTSSTVTNLNVWNHVAAVRNGTAVSLYLNGVQVATGTSSKDEDYSLVDFNIATLRSDNLSPATGNPGLSFQGNISNLRLVKGTAVYTSAFTPPTAPLTAISGTSILTCQSNRFIDNSSNAFAITVAGNTSVQAFSPFDPTTAYSAGTVGGSGYFDGSGDNLSVADNAAFEFGSGSFTIELWFYLGASGVNALVTKNRSGTSPEGGLCIDVSTTTIRTYIDGNAGTTLVPNISTTISLNTWYHLAVVRSVAGGTNNYVFLNGISVGTSTTSTAFADTSQPLRIATDNLSGSNYNQFTGYISSVRIVKGSAVYTSNFTPPTAPLTAIANTSLLLNYTNGGIIDAAAKNVLETVGGAAISTAQSKFGGSSMAFDGTTDYVVQPSSLNYGYGTGDFTIEFWLYLNSTGLQTIVSNLSAATGGVQPHIYINTTIRYYTNSADRITGAALSAGQWYHIAVSRGSGSTRLFVNGTQSGSTYADTNNYTATAPLGVGTYWEAGAPVTTSTLNGYIDDLRITKGLARYTTTFTPPTAAFPTQ